MNTLSHMFSNAHLFPPPSESPWGPPTSSVKLDPNVLVEGIAQAARGLGGASAREGMAGCPLVSSHQLPKDNHSPRVPPVAGGTASSVCADG
jgi:hypothetical protein